MCLGFVSRFSDLNVGGDGGARTLPPLGRGLELSHRATPPVGAYRALPFPRHALVQAIAAGRGKLRYGRRPGGRV